MSPRFTDAKGRPWELRIPFSERGFLRERGIDLSNPGAALRAIWGLLLDEPEALVEIAYKLGSPQRDTVSPGEFAAGLVGGQVLYDLATALSAGVIDFFPLPQVRRNLSTALAGLLATPPTSTSTDSSGKPPAAPGSATPAPAHSAS